MAETALSAATTTRRPVVRMPDRLPGDRGDGPLAHRLAREWLAALGGDGRPGVAGDPGEILGPHAAERILLTDIASRLVAILFGVPFEPEAAALAGRAFVAAGFTGSDVLGRSLRVLMLFLPDLGSRLAEVTGAFADGYARALRDRAIAEQQSLRRAELDAERLLSRQLRYQATHDPLTGLPNRTEAFSRLSAALSAGPGARVGLCYLDLDGFKAVNDSHGHAAGDQLLTAVAERFRRVARRHGALAARIGGDEFVVVAEDSPGLAGMITLAAALLAEARRPIALSSGVVSVSACAGIVDRTAEGSTAESVVAAADAALYEAKAHGPNRCSALPAPPPSAPLQRG